MPGPRSHYPPYQQHHRPNGNIAQSISVPASSPEALALARLRHKSIWHPMQQCQLTIYIASHMIGAVIGRGGKTILNVQREAMRRSLDHPGPVRINVLGGNNVTTTATTLTTNLQPSDEDNDFFPNSQAVSSTSLWNYHEYQDRVNQQLVQSPTDNGEEIVTSEDDEWTPVIIRGDPVGCFAAVRQIVPMVDNAYDPDVVFDVPILRPKHNLLIGKQGLVLAALSATYDVRIMVPPKDVVPTPRIARADYTYPPQQASSEAGSQMLFSDISGKNIDTKEHLKSIRPSSQIMELPPNIIQLEGVIDKVELCLVKILSIVAGERWHPTGIIVQSGQEDAGKFDAASTVASHELLNADNNNVTRDNIGKVAVNVTARTITSDNRMSQGLVRTLQKPASTIVRGRKVQ